MESFALPVGKKVDAKYGIRRILTSTHYAQFIFGGFSLIAQSNGTPRQNHGLQALDQLVKNMGV